MKLHTTEELRHLQTTGEFPVSTFPVLNAKYSDRWDKAKELCEQFTQPLFWIDAHMHVNGDRNQSEQKITFEKIHEKNNEVNYEGNIWGWNQDYYYKNEKNDPSYYTLRKKLYINGGSRVSADNYKFSNPIFDYWLDFYDDMYPIVEHYARNNFTDINKFIDYNFRDVEILVELDKKLEYLALTKNLSHKGKHNYGEVYHNTVTQDGAISAYLLSQGIIPPPKEKYPEKKKGYAGGYLFCPKAGIYKYMFDEDLTSLYPCIIMSLNIGKETMVGRIVSDTLPENLRYRPYMNAETGLPIPSRNNYLGLNDLKKKDPQEKLTIENAKGKRTQIEVDALINLIEDMEMAVSANGTFFRTDKQSVLSIILDKWFNERVKYKTQMKKAYKAGNAELGASFHLKQYTMKILLNSLYGATALPSFRYAMNKAILSEAITLSGWRIIQESALAANRHINKLMKTEV